MKHLKKYKLFEQEDLISDVRDILADVSDKERAELVVDDNSIIIGPANIPVLNCFISTSDLFSYFC